MDAVCKTWAVAAAILCGAGLLTWMENHLTVMPVAASPTGSPSSVTAVDASFKPVTMAISATQQGANFSSTSVLREFRGGSRFGVEK